MLWCDLCVMFGFSFAKLFSASIFETCFCFHLAIELPCFILCLHIRICSLSCYFLLHLYIRFTSLLQALSGDISLNPGPGSRSLSGCLLNVRSIRNKSASFLEFVKDNADLIAVTETWLRPEDTESFISSITPPGYKFTHVPWNIKKGGGVGFFIKEDLSYE